MLDEYSEFSRKFNLLEQRGRIYYNLRGRVAPSQSTYKEYKIVEENRKRVKIPICGVAAEYPVIEFL